MIKEIVPSDNIYGYRNKITLKVKGGKIGYFKNGTNELIEINRCEISSEKSNEIIEVLKKCDLSKVCEIIIKDFGEVMIIIKGDMDIEVLKPLTTSIYMNDRLVYGNENIIAQLGDFKFYVSKDSFFQVNTEVALKLYNKVLDAVHDGADVLDAEKKYFDSDHVKTGSLMAKRWQLPILLANIISYHHMPSLSSIPLPCNLVCMVDKLVQEEFNPSSLDKDFIKTLGIDFADIEDLRTTIMQKSELLISELA